MSPNLPEIPFDSGLLAYLGQFITPHKKSLIEEILGNRTRFFTVVLENIHKPHNASAVIRTCDCFGIQDLHIIEKSTPYQVNPYVTRGASQWVNLHTYQDTAGHSVDRCFDQLRKEGYKIFGTSPKPTSLPITKVEPTGKMALVFGNEHEGLSPEVLDKIDGLLHIPMLGFTESFNISVSVSILLYDLVNKAKTYGHPDYFLSEEEKNILRMNWYRGILKHADLHEKTYWKNHPAQGSKASIKIPES